ncbi:hypothetical protein GCM10027214_08240 [Stenotrophomonas tumulicola]
MTPAREKQRVMDPLYRGGDSAVSVVTGHARHRAARERQRVMDPLYQGATAPLR